MAGSIGSHDTGGVTTTGGVCWTDPADMAGQVNSLQERLTKVEQILSLLCGMDITAAQLSDITSSAGTLTDMMAILSNINGGWITEGTFTGTAISTLGWPFFNSCTGEMESWPIVTMQDGVLQFGLSETGKACGEQVEYWNEGGAAAGAAAVDYAISKRKSGSLYNSSRGITITTSPPLGEGTAVLTVTQAGVYMVGAVVNAGTSPLAVGTLSVSVPDTDQNVGDIHSSSSTSWEVTTLVNVAAGDTINITFDVPGVVTVTATYFEVTAFRVSGAA